MAADSSPPPVVAVFGATGLVGRRIAATLAARAEVRVVLVGRHSAALAQLAPTAPGAVVRAASLEDPAGLARAFAGARVVVNAAGPIAEVGDGVLIAAMRAGAHYVDCGGDQAFQAQLYERHESTARHAGLVAMPGAGVDGVLGDLAAAWAAAHVCGAEPDPAVVRTAPADRLAEAAPLDAIGVSYVIDDLALSAASQRTLFANLAGRALYWRRDRWEPAPAGERRRVNAGTAFGGERDAVTFGSSDALTIPRHTAAARVQGYVSTTRRPMAATALRLIARALPFVPRTAGSLLAAYAPADVDYARTRFAVVADARRGFDAAQITVAGRDLYATTAALTAWVAELLALRAVGPVGMRAPAELFGPRAALEVLARRAGLAITTSFG